jgi:CARDB
LSFFDEADEPRAAQPTPPRGRRPTGSGRRPPTDSQVFQVRRAVAAVAILIVVILIVLGVHSCQVSQRNSSLKSYNGNVAGLVQQSDQNGGGLFQVLSGASANNLSNLQSQVDEKRIAAEGQLTRAQGLDVPDEMKPAQQNLVLLLQMRRDGIATIAQQIQPALGAAASKQAIDSIAGAMAAFYASDVVYKSYTAPLIAGALHGAGIGVGPPNGQIIYSGQFVPNVLWVTPAYVATQLHVTAPSASGKPAPGTHGHSLNSVSVGGTTLQTGSTNTIPATPPPTFTFNFTNGGTNTETNVVLKVTVSGTSVSGQTVVPQTSAGQQTTGQVTLSSSPPAGNYTVTATVEPVPGETNTSNNSLSFPVTFQ